MQDLDFRLGRIEAKLDSISAALVEKEAAFKDHEQRIRYVERFVYGTLTIVATVVTATSLYKTFDL